VFLQNGTTLGHQTGGLLFLWTHLAGAAHHSSARAAARAQDVLPELKVLLMSGGEADGRGFSLLRKPFTEPDLRRFMAEIDETLLTPARTSI
jgi:hypothetical protein